MTAPRLEACYFAGTDRHGKWDRLARVLQASAAQHCQGWDVRVWAMPPPVVPSDANGRTYTCNTHKLDRWRDVVLAAEDGDRILLIDADTILLRPLDDVWDEDFDLAYTTKRIQAEARVRNVDRFPLNGGVVFLRVSLRTKAFLTEWASENRMMLEDKDRHRPWLYRYGGINQAALGRLLKEGKADGLRLLDLPCDEWNCEDSTWASFDHDRTRILHVKSDLRRACFHPYARTPELDPLMRIWQAADRVASPQSVEA